MAATMRFYAKKFVLKESSVRTWKNAYTRVFEPARRACGKRRSQPGIVGGEFWNSGKLDREKLPFCENWTPRKFLLRSV